jgi:hypothetical protein
MVLAGNGLLAGIGGQGDDGPMTGHACPRSIARLVLAVSLAVASLGGLAASSPDASASALSRWTGGIDLYRSGVFTTQKSWLWCTAADVQIIRNIADHQADHSTASQQRYFDYMRGHNRYRIPVSDGVDPAGWTAGLRHFVDGRYRLYASRSFDSALRSAVTNLRKTNLPVAITVSHGNHAWVLTGFTATADPATTSHFNVTSVRVVGPLWGLQSRSYGYDMRADTKLTPSQLRGFFTPWHYTSVPMAWEDRWVSVQPVAIVRAPPKPVATSKPTPRPAASLRALPTASPMPDVTPGASPTAGVSPPEVAVAANPSAGTRGGAGAATSPATTPTADSSAPGLLGGLVTLVAFALAAVGGLALASHRRRRGPSGRG